MRDDDGGDANAPHNVTQAVPAARVTSRQRRAAQAQAKLGGQGAWCEGFKAGEAPAMVQAKVGSSSSTQQQAHRSDLRTTGSSAPKGSSSSSRRGLQAKARATATRCFWPPDSCRRAGGRRRSGGAQLGGNNMAGNNKVGPPG